MAPSQACLGAPWTEEPETDAQRSGQAPADDREDRYGNEQLGKGQPQLASVPPTPRGRTDEWCGSRSAHIAQFHRLYTTRLTELPVVDCTLKLIRCTP
jgi:hypothetical protein